MMNARRWIGVCALTVLAAPAFAQQPAAAGRIKLASGQVFVVRGGNSVPAKLARKSSNLTVSGPAATAGSASRS